MSPNMVGRPMDEVHCCDDYLFIYFPITNILNIFTWLLE